MVAILILGAGLLAWQGDRVAEKVLDLRFGATLEKPRFPQPANQAEANRQDLAYLDRLTEVDRSFSPQAAAAFHRSVAELGARAGSLSQAEFLLGVAGAVALAGNAHTSVDSRAWREHLDSAPVRLEWFEEGLFVARAMTAYAGLLGARVLSIGGIDTSQLLGEAARFFPGPAEHVRVASPLLLEAPEALHALHRESPPDRLVMRVMDRSGMLREVELPAVPRAEAPGSSTPGRLLSPVPLAVEKAGLWQSARDRGAPIPVSLREPRRSVYAAPLAEGVLYLHLWQVRDDAGGPVAGAIARALGPEREPPWKRIILDLRFNGGGDYSTVYAALRALPRRLATDGRLVLLQDNTTFSAAIITVALARHFAGGRALIVGDAPGDRLEFWAEGNDIHLPNSKVRVTTSTAYHDWAHGCRELRCYWPNFWYDIAAGSVQPDIVVRWRFEDYQRGIDTVLNRALQA